MPKINCILLVDDDKITNYINKRLVEKLNIADLVRVVTNGAEALDYIDEYCNADNKCCPDLILLDINMPVMNGFEFLRQFSQRAYKNEKAIVIVMLTTSTSLVDKDKIADYNISGYINKPLTEENLMKIVNQHFENNEKA